MKKIITLLIIVLVLFGCTNNGGVKIANGSDAVISKDGKAIFTKNDLAEKMLYQINTDEILASVEEQIYTLEKFPSIEEELNKTIETYKKQLGDNFTLQLSYLGYPNEEMFKESLAKNLKSLKLVTEYLKINEENYFNDYSPIKIQYAAFENEEIANKALADLKNNKDFETVAKENNTSVNPAEMIITQKSSINAEVKAYVLENHEIGLSNVVKLTTSQADDPTKTLDRWFIFNIIDNNVENFKDDALAEISKTVDKAEVYKYYFDKYNFEVYNQNIYEAVNEKYKGVLD